MTTPYPLLLLFLLAQWSCAPAAFAEVDQSAAPSFPDATIDPSTQVTLAPSAPAFADGSTTPSPTTTAGSAQTGAPAPAAVTCRPFSLQPPSGKQWIIAHRGASAHLPEHTLASYRLAMELGANWVEPDLIATADRQLIAMHTLDLNVTTNVAAVYGEDRQWYSPFANRTGWWAFNFTLDEITNLTVVQRLPEARTTLYNYLFPIPTLTQIVQLVNHWNTVDLPQLSTTASVQKQLTGIYAELKDADWLQQDAGIDLVELLYQNFVDAEADWSAMWKSWSHNACQHHSGIVPPLVLQSFDASTLKNFSGLWKSHDFATKVGEPPYVLLVSKPQCWLEDFWFTVGDLDRGFLSGLGPDKACLLEDSSAEVEEGMAVLEKAKQYRLQVHPWTERPETTYMSTGFKTLEEELTYLLCDLKVPGIFTESVATAVQVAAIGCDAYLKPEVPPVLSINETALLNMTTDDGTDNSSSTNETQVAGTPSSSSSSAPFCPTDGNQANLYFGLASFIVGAFAAVVVLLLMAGRNPLRPGQRSYRTRRRRNDREQVYNQASPREDDDQDDHSTNDNVELT